MGPLGRTVLAAAAGVAAACAFEPLGWAPLLLPAVAGLCLAVRGLRRLRAFWVGLAFGFAFMAGLLPWLRVIGVDAWLGLSLIEGAFYGVLGILVARVQRLPGWPVWAAACWAAVDTVRSAVPWGGFPWGRLAFATVDTPLAPAIRLLGTSGSTFLVALLGATLAWWLTAGRWRRGRSVLGVAVVVGVAAVPALLPAASATGGAGSAGTARVAAVQGNVPGEGMEAFAERRAVLDNHVRATHELAARIDAGRTPRPRFVLWPENSTDIDPFEDATVYADIQNAVDAVGVPVLVGAMVAGPGPADVRNQGIVWNPVTGPGETYSKTHPVPFGEYIPMRAELAHLFKRLDQIPRAMVPGTRPGVLDIDGTTIGDLICFEVAYDGLVRDVVDGGARMLVVQTNNATYMGTGQIEQQFAIARLRALETGRWVVVVATNGVSGIVAPDGSVAQRAPVRQTAVLEAGIPMLTGVTPAMRVSGRVETGLVLLAVGALLAGVVRDRRRRGSGLRAAPSQTSEPLTSGTR